MLEKLLKKLLKKAYPDREYNVVNIGGRNFIVAQDEIGACRDFLLEGTYTYEEVVKLNALTPYNASFGYCIEIGPVALIGIPNPASVGESGYFKYVVHEYGKPSDDSEYYFEAFTEEEAKEIGNYTVYGKRSMNDGFDKIAKVAKISKLSYVYDSRYKAKSNRNSNRVYSMDLKLAGTYSFNDAKILATGTTRKKDGYSGDDRPIAFATVGDNYHVGLINIWDSDTKFMTGFRDVWEYGCEQPEIQKITFLSDEEAKKIKDFSLYVYEHSYGFGISRYTIEKRDRTLDSRFDFYLPDGTDYRLI